MDQTLRAAPAPFSRRARRWTRDNLFGGIPNTLLTVITLLVASYLAYQILRWTLFIAEWEVIEANRRLFFIGRYPSGEEWRLWPPILVFSALVGLTWGLWSRIEWPAALGLGVALVPVFLFFAHGTVGLLTAVAVALPIIGYLFTQARLVPARYEPWLRQLIIAGWALVFPLALFMLLAFGGVDPSRWSGFYLNVLLAVFAIVASFPFGVLLALGRTSNYPVIRFACTIYIETIRGVPLITILLVGWLVLPDFLPSFSVPIIAPDGLDRMELMYRVMIALACFSAAYVAEAVRGGLQAVPSGQVEAAQALGLSTVRILALIVLPQALRAVIPALVGQFISIFKDTSLIFVVGGVELLRAGRLIAEGQLEFTSNDMEVLLFVALLFWIVAFSMSRLSQRLEQTLGVGER